MAIYGLTNYGKMALKGISGASGVQKRPSEKVYDLWGGRGNLKTFFSAFAKSLPKYEYSPFRNSFLYVRENWAHNFIFDGGYVKENVLNLKHEYCFDASLKLFEDYGLVKRIEEFDGYSESHVINFSPRDFEKHNSTIGFRDLFSKAIIELTEMCNLKCMHCYRDSREKKENGLDPDTLKQVLTPLIRIGTSIFEFTGGEPALRRNALMDLVGWLDSYNSNYNINVLTNGFVKNPEHFISRIRTNNIMFQISLDSFNEEVHDSNRGKKGSFRKALAFIEACEKLDVRYRITALNMGGINSKAEKNLLQKLKNKIWTDSSIEIPLIDVGNFRRNGLNRRYKLTFDLDEFFYGISQFRSFDSMIIRPNGRIGSHHLQYLLPEEFGLIKNDSIVDIINDFENSRLYNLIKSFASKENFDLELDSDVWEKGFGSYRTMALAVIDFTMRKQDLMAKGHLEKEAIKLANLDSAKALGF